MKYSQLLVLAALLACAPLSAQEPVLGRPNPESLFKDSNPRLNANKQVVLHIMLDLLECNHWDEADKWLTPTYIQHNPNVISGRDAVVKFSAAVPRNRSPRRCRRKSWRSSLTATW